MEDLTIQDFLDKINKAIEDGLISGDQIIDNVNISTDDNSLEIDMFGGYGCAQCADPLTLTKEKEILCKNINSTDLAKVIFESVDDNTIIQILGGKMETPSGPIVFNYEDEIYTESLIEKIEL